MSQGRIEADALQSARVCAGLGTVLNWAGKTFAVADFLPGQAAKPMKVSASEGVQILKSIYL
jgi:hypothetical protein